MMSAFSLAPYTLTIKSLFAYQKISAARNREGKTSPQVHTHQVESQHSSTRTSAKKTALLSFLPPQAETTLRDRSQQHQPTRYHSHQHPGQHRRSRERRNRT